MRYGVALGVPMSLFSSPIASQHCEGPAVSEPLSDAPGNMSCLDLT